MARVLAYRIQAAEFGDLDRAILRRLRERKGVRSRLDVRIRIARFQCLNREQVI